MDGIPFLDLTAPGFSTRGAAVLKARAEHWCARTPFGWAILRHRQAGQILRDRRFRQGSHAWPDLQGLTGSFSDFWKASIISQEGADHKAQRALVQHALHADIVDALVPRFTNIADDLATQIANRDCDFVDEFTEPFAGRAITTLLALPDNMAPRIAHNASCLGLAMGPDCLKFQNRSNSACTALGQLARDLIKSARDGNKSDGLVARLLDAPGAASWPDEVIVNLIIILIFGGVDTTRAQLAFAMAHFADHPDQWDWLRQNPGQTPQTVEEVIRHRPTTTWASREVLEPLELDAVKMQPGDTVHILVHATGTDTKDRIHPAFDIRKPGRMHFGFGGGAHHCLGQYVARTDMAAALKVLVRRFSQVEWAGAPAYLPDSGNTSPLAMPLKLRS